MEQETIADRIKSVAKQKEIPMATIAKELQIGYSAFYQKTTGSVKVETLRQIADILRCEIAELIPTGPEYAHFYDRGQWLGIRKK